MGDFTWVDYVRVVIMACALWLAALMGRLAILRFIEARAGAGRDEGWSWLMYLSYSLGMLAIVFFRLRNLGMPFLPETAFSLVIVGTGMAGALLRVRLGKPGRRR